MEGSGLDTDEGDLKPLLPQLGTLLNDGLHASPSSDATAIIVEKAATTESLPERPQFLAYLYISHFLTRWGARMWEFAVGLFMIEIWPDSLLLTSVYGLVEDLAVVSMGVSVGKWVDTTSRLKVVQVSLGVRNGSVMAAALALVILLLHPGIMLGGYKTFFSLVALVNIFGGVSALAALATNIAVERDWVLAISEGKRLVTLAEMNSVMRGIDLSCKLLAPVLVGIIMSSLSVLAAAILISVWNVVSIGFEYYFLLSVYYRNPELHQRQTPRDKGTYVVVGQELQDISNVSQESIGETHIHGINSLNENIEGFGEGEMNFRQDDQGLHFGFCSTQRMWRMMSRWCTCIRGKVLNIDILEGLKVYARQEMLLAALALAMLYFTVLSFGSLMTAALKWKGVPPYVLGLARGVSALVGISATLAYPRVQARLQTARTGLWSATLQWSFLSLCVASTWFSSLIMSATLLMGGVAASRFGLWMFDLAVLQLMQESVPESERGIVGGVQNSLQSFLEMLSFGAAILIPHPQDFGKLVFLSYGAVTAALVLYTIQVYRIRGHLFHMDHVFRSR